MKQQILEKWEETQFVENRSRDKLPNIIKDRKAKELVKASNKALIMIKEQLQKPLNVTEIDELLYTTATVITEKIGVRFKNQRKSKRKQPAWKERIEKEISRVRGDPSMLTELAKDNGVSERKKKKS